MNKSTSDASTQLNSHFFRPNLFNLFNLVGLIICLSFYAQLNQLENRIQHLERHCTLDNDKVQKKIGLNNLNALTATEPSKESILPISIVEFVDQVSCLSELVQLSWIYYRIWIFYICVCIYRKSSCFGLVAGLPAISKDQKKEREDFIIFSPLSESFNMQMLDDLIIFILFD